MKPANTPIQTETDKIPLVVDLDGTLLKTDCLHEGIASWITRNPLSLYRLFQFKNRLELKETVEQSLDVDTLPVNQDILDILRKEKSAGRQIWLATASPLFIARKIANRLDIFDGVLASEKDVNLKGKNKAEALCEKFGVKQFDYMGDSSADLPIWKEAKTAIVTGNKHLYNKVRNINSSSRFIPSYSASFKSVLKCLRIHQWIKNLLVFVPLFLADTLSWSNLIKCTTAFFCLGFCASAIYIVNDLCDLAGDRLHPKKKFRPLAYGDVSIAQSVGLFFGSILLAMLFSLFLVSAAYKYLLAYMVLTLLYSFLLKRIHLLDVIVLACLYIIRLGLGGSVTDVILSNWLISFSFFIFTSLALIKRWGELIVREKQEKLPGRAYQLTDLPAIRSMAISSGFCSLVILAIYIDSLQAHSLYRHPDLLWLVCPLVLWWEGRLFIMAGRGEMGDDPIDYAAKDKLTWAIFCAIFLIMVGARINF